jgi:predicted Zn-dependent protease
MLFSGFRIRSARRDSETDRIRFERLSQMIAKLGDEIENERAGLERRYSETKTSAAFAQAAFENEGDPTISSRVNELTSSMMRYKARIEALGKQKAFVASIEKKVGDFVSELGATNEDETL